MHVFVLNLDAEDELADPSAQTSSNAMRARIRELEPKLAALVADGRVLREGERVPGARGLAWCPTPSAIARLRAGGAIPVAAPTFAVLRRVNHRRFSFDLGATLPGERWATTTADVVAACAEGGTWLLKAGWGFAGRGRLRLEAPMNDADRARIERIVAGEGAQLEPLVERTGDFAIHGWLGEDGTLVRGAPTRQECDDRGAWIATTRDEGSALAVPCWDELTRVGEALHRAGYFGPFGIDGFSWTEGGRVHHRLRSEINARYSMGWAIGMGARRPDLDG